jgi:hypothetical protein
MAATLLTLFATAVVAGVYTRWERATLQRIARQRRAAAAAVAPRTGFAKSSSFRVGGAK